VNFESPSTRLGEWSATTTFVHLTHHPQVLERGEWVTVMETFLTLSLALRRHYHRDRCHLDSPVRHKAPGYAFD